MILRGPARPEHLRHEILADLFETTATRMPEQVAICAPDRRLSYRELDRLADCMAHHLLAQGVVPGDKLGLWLPRGWELLVAQLAIAKTGAAWLPLDADVPPERVMVCLEDANARGIVTTEAARSSLDAVACSVWSCRGLSVEPTGPWLRRGPAQPQQPAYVIYTSGSTGKPKGVPITQAAICHFLRSENEVLGVTAQDRVYQGFSVAFDMSFEEIWIAYLVGASLWLPPSDITADPDALPLALQANGVTVLHAVPTLLALFSQDVPGLRLVNLGGEMCPPALVDRWATPGRRLFNSYGPTEATVSASLAELRPGQPVTIGTPLPNYGLVVLGPDLQALPAGSTGELCITGPGVASGYLGRPGLTAEKFLPNPWAEHPQEARLYRTGDLARINEQGQVVCLGRVDDQVKVRGFRVELGEIEAVLARELGQGTAAVVLKNVAGVEQLVAYWSPGTAEGQPHPLPGVWRERLRAHLPPYMVPARLECVSRLPRLTSGKIDRKVLQTWPCGPEPEAEPAPESDLSVAEQALFAALRPLFPGVLLRRQDDFFDDLGGHSLLAARLVSGLRQDPRFARLTVHTVYQKRRLDAIAAAMQTPTTVAANAAEPSPVRVFPWKPWACGGAQLLVFPVLVALHIAHWLAPFFTYHYHTGEPGDSLWLAVLMSLSVFLLCQLLGFGVAILGSRLCLRGLNPGRYPLWGAVYFRWWLGDRLQQLAPTYLLGGSSLYLHYLRALGAQIGPEVVIGSVTLRQPHALRIGAHSSLGNNVNLENVWVENGWLWVGQIEIGQGVYVGSYSVLEGQTRVADGARLEGLSALARGTVVGATEVWEGAPARCLGGVAPPQYPTPPKVGWAQRTAETVFFAAGAALTSVLFFLPIFPAFILIDTIEERLLEPSVALSGALVAIFQYTLLALPASALLVLGTALVAAAVRWSVLPRLQPGTWPVHSAMYCRKWLANQIQVASLHVLHGIYATVYAPWWYRLLGAKVGKHAEISTAMGLVPDLLTLGDDCFIADAVMLGDEEVDQGWLSVQRTVIGERTFVGNGAYVPDGSVLPPDVLIGVQSKTPSAAVLRPGQTWVGSPALHLPARECVQGFSQALTFRPSGWRRLGRALVEAARILLPLSLVIGCGYVIVQVEMPLAEEGAWLRLLWELAGIGLAYGAACFGLVWALKWGLIGRYVDRSVPMWTPFVWLSEAVTNLYEAMAVPNALEYLRGTPWLPWALRSLGVKIGQGVYLDTTDITEFDCVQIGDHSALNACSGPQTHLFEDRVMKIGTIHIGQGVTLGARATVLYGAQIGDRVVLGPLSLVMKGESLPPGGRWIGSPAQAWD